MLLIYRTALAIRAPWCSIWKCTYRYCRKKSHFPKQNIEQRLKQFFLYTSHTTSSSSVQNSTTYWPADASCLLPQLQFLLQVSWNSLLLTKSYTGRAEAVSHEEIKSSTGLSPCNVYAAAAVMENSLTEVSTLFHLFFKQEISKLRETEKIPFSTTISGH